MVIRLVTFDLYGTLVDWRYSISTVLNYIHRGMVERFFEKEFSIVKEIKTYTSYTEILEKALRETLGEFNVEFRKEYARLLVTSFAKSPFFPDSILGLIALKKAGYRTGIISNTDRSLVKITLSGVEDLFDYIVTAEDTGYYKPDERAFINAYKIMNVELEEAVHVSSYPQYDLEPANKLGVKTIYLDRYGYTWKNRINNLEEIIGKIKEL
ncbi:MAG: HAD-IA family hydrolase [Nitrososphaerota archaeon]